MAATANHSKEAVIAAGLMLRAKGKEPTQALLFTTLGRTGHPKTIWKYWTEFVATQPDTGALPNPVGLPQPMSAEMTHAHRGILAVVSAFTQQATREAKAPLLAENEALKAALVQSRKRDEDKDELIDILQEVIQSLQAQLATQTAPQTSLILPRR